MSSSTTMGVTTRTKQNNWSHLTSQRARSVPLLILLLSVFTSIGQAQFVLNEGFEDVAFPPNGWSTTGTLLWDRGTESYSGSGCARILYDPAHVNSILISPIFILPANHRISFWWKDDDIDLVNRPTLKEKKNATEKVPVTQKKQIGIMNPRVAGYDSTFFEISTDGGTTWISLDTLATPTPDTSYNNILRDLSAYAGNDFCFRFRDWSDGPDFAFGSGVDSIRIEPNPEGPPNCASIGSPADLATNVQTIAALNWTVPAGGGAPTGYKLYFGTDNPPTNIVNGTNLGNVFSYDPTPDMAYATTYYWKVIPTNASGDATGCPVWSFTTQTNPNWGGGGAGQGFYFFANSTQGGAPAPSQPSYSWIDPVAAGHTLVLDADWAANGGTGDDGWVGPFDAGFSFNFFGTAFTQAYIGSNGLVTFGSGSNSFVYATIPTAAAPNNLIAGAWTDLVCETGTYADAKVYHGTITGGFVATFIHAHVFGSLTDYITFQIIIKSNGNIKIQYNDVETTIPPPSSIIDNCAVGIENADGTLGIQYRFNGAGGLMFGSPLALEFGLNQGALPIQLTSFTAQLNQSGGVRLNWTTASETNNYGFYVQRRLSGTQDWTMVSDLIPGHGTTLEPHSYSFVDSSVPAPGMYQYRLRQIDLDGAVHHIDPISIVVGLTTVKELAPNEFTLLQNYPNPFNPSAEIKFSVERSGLTTLKIYNVLGQEVATPFNDIAEAGQYYKVKVDANNFASGMYFYKLESGQKRDIKKMLLLR